jgi:HAD superfamily phosphatase (TIGR01668 family)
MFFPHFYCSRVTTLDARHLRRHDISGLLIDIDGTLKDFHASAPTPVVVAWLRQLQTDGIRVCLLSNGRPARISAIADRLKLPYIAQAMKPLPFGCLRGVKLLDLPRRNVAVVGDQIFADVIAGRLAGLSAILVQPTSRAEPWFTRLKRPFELPLRRALRGRLDRFDH